MLGKRYLLATNALVALLQGHDGGLRLTGQAQWLGVSVINVLEFLGFDRFDCRGECGSESGDMGDKRFASVEVGG